MAIDPNIADGVQSIPNTEFVERCQMEYNKNPSSKVFAPLAEAYRKRGMLAEAFEVAGRGVRLHPDFAAGRIAFARILIAKQAYNDAIEQLQKAAELSPDNLLAFQLIGETYLELRKPREALKAFKMVLFLSPLHERAQKMVRKWEFLTADEFDEEEFAWKPSENDPLPELDSKKQRELAKALKQDPTRADKEAYRAISIADALTVRNDLEGAFAVLGRAMRQLGPRDDLRQRLHLLGKRLGLEAQEVELLAKDSAARLESQTNQKREKLKSMLNRISRPR